MPEPNDPIRIVNIAEIATQVADQVSAEIGAEIFEDFALGGIDEVTADSVAYKLAEIEGHFHNWSRGFGLAAAPSGETHRADSILTVGTPFTLTAGNNAFGNWLQILGSSDTPFIPGMAKFDLNFLHPVSASAAGTYIIQIAFGATAAGALTAGTYTDLILSRAAAAQGTTSPITVMMHRQAAGTKVWARLKVPGGNGTTVGIFFGLHEYLA